MQYNQYESLKKLRRQPRWKVTRPKNARRTSTWEIAKPDAKKAVLHYQTLKLSIIHLPLVSLCNEQ